MISATGSPLAKAGHIHLATRLTLRLLITAAGDTAGMRLHQLRNHFGLHSGDFMKKLNFPEIPYESIS